MHVCWARQCLLEHHINEAACLLVSDGQHGAVGVALVQRAILHYHVAKAGVQLTAGTQQVQALIDVCTSQLVSYRAATHAVPTDNSPPRMLCICD